MADWALEIEKAVVRIKESERILTFSINFFILFSFKIHTISIIQFFGPRRNFFARNIMGCCRSIQNQAPPASQNRSRLYFWLVLCYDEG